MIIAGIELTDEQVFELREHFYNEYDKELIRRMLDVLQVYSGLKGEDAVIAYISGHRDELVETYAPNMRRYFDEAINPRFVDASASILDSLWNELPWDIIEEEIEGDTK